MPEYNPCNSCWVNLGNCNGLGALALCCGYWCFKGPVMEHHDPNCCYCFEMSGFGCNFFCLGCVCCHPPWFTGYVHNHFNQPQGQPQAELHHPTPNPTYIPQNPSPIHLQPHNHDEHHHHHGPAPLPVIFQDINFAETPSPIVRDPQTHHAF